MNSDNFAIIMAGGIGSRFWPVSTRKKPKQFRDLLGSGQSLLQTTFKRLNKLIPANNIYVLTNESYSDLVMEQLPELDSEQVVLEPVLRNTAPAVLLASLKIRKKNPNAVMVMAPSDHWIEDEAAFISDVEAAFEACRMNSILMTIGIEPDFPNTGFGYIETQPGVEKIKKVKKFTEKPDFEKARGFLSSGNYRWNAGIFIWNVSTILSAFERHLPIMYNLFAEGEALLNSESEKEFVSTYYPKADNISIDYAILEKEDEVYMISAGFDWNDLGTWGSLYRESEKDDDKNAVLNSRVFAEDASGNIISSNSNKVVVVEGISDYIIIDEEEVLLLVPREREQEIKNIRAKVQTKFGDDLG